MRRMLEAQAPAKQTATDTIATLSSRLTNATLLEDRRAAILGLRSFAKEYPASVASGALRGLISSLRKDAEDVDTTKVVLETLLMLFNPKEDSPEASEDIALWLADEFTQRQDNITILLDFLEPPDFYSRLYSLQLITAIAAARPERTQECVLSAPLGTTRLVATLDDPRDAVRNAGLILLTDLTQSSVELQKLVAFENAFDRVFRLIQAEGSLSQGGIVVQDCLSLLANLIRYNAPNQSLFRETGNVARLKALLSGGTRSAEDDDWASPQKDKNLWGLLAVLRMFFVPGNIGTQQNQEAFQKQGVLKMVLDLAFSDTTPVPIRTEALYLCADMIRGFPRLQGLFAQLQVRNIRSSPISRTDETAANGTTETLVIEALLDLVLNHTSTQMFDVRFAACECIKAYLNNNKEARLQFLQYAMDVHTSGAEDPCNVLTVLIRGPQASQSVDPYRSWFAAVIVFHLIRDDLEAKHVLMTVTEGDAGSGEEVVTCIQAICGNMIAALQGGADDRSIVGYLTLFTGWLFEDKEAVDDFLGEGSSLQVLVQRASRSNQNQVLVRGLCAALLGTIYEFSTKDSPIPRRKLQPILISALGRERYLDALTQLRQHPFVRDFEVLPQGAASAPPGNIPEVYFDKGFMDFFKDNFSRLARAIGKDPGLEIQQTNDGIDRDLVDALRAQLEEKSQALQNAESELLTMERRLNQEQADSRRAQEVASAELNRIKSINGALQTSITELERTMENRLKQEQTNHQRARDDLQQSMAELERTMQSRLSQEQADHQRTREVSAAEMNRVSNSNTALQKNIAEVEQALSQTRSELAVARGTIVSLEATLQQNKAQTDELQRVRDQAKQDTEKHKVEISELKRRIQDRDAAVKRTEEESERARRALNEKELALSEKEKALVEKEEARNSAQTELDDLLMVLGDLEEKRSRDKKRLRALGEETSDVEDEQENDDDDDDDDDDEDEDENGDGNEDGEGEQSGDHDKESADEDAEEDDAEDVKDANKVKAT